MQTLYKTTLAAAAALGLALAATPASAGQDDIVVKSSAEMAAWQKDVTRDLNNKLRTSERFHSIRPESGIVQIRFTLDESGRPQDLKTYRSSGHVGSDRAATWAVRRLSRMDEAPVSNPDRAVFQANIIYAENRQDYARLAAELQESERARLASASSEVEVIALGG